MLLVIFIVDSGSELPCMTLPVSKIHGFKVLFHADELFPLHKTQPHPWIYCCCVTQMNYLLSLFGGSRQIIKL